MIYFPCLQGISDENNNEIPTNRANKNKHLSILNAGKDVDE